MSNYTARECAVIVRRAMQNDRFWFEPTGASVFRPLEGLLGRSWKALKRKFIAIYQTFHRHREELEIFLNPTEISVLGLLNRGLLNRADLIHFAPQRVRASPLLSDDEEEQQLREERDNTQDVPRSDEESNEEETEESENNQTLQHSGEEERGNSGINQREVRSFEEGSKNVHNCRLPIPRTSYNFRVRKQNNS